MNVETQAAALMLYFAEDALAALSFAGAANLESACIERHRFPDGELKLRLPPSLPPKIVMHRTLDHPNEKLLEILLVVKTARLHGAQHITLVAPYLGYMRQDIAFQPGEVVSQKVVGQFLAGLFDAVITVDPHLHRVATLQEAVPATRGIALSGAPLLADWIAKQEPNAMLVGPDEESAQWVAQAAARHGFAYAVCRKIRHGDRHVEIVLPPLQLQGRAVVLLDDVASSGHTLAETSRLLLAGGASSVDVAVTHALFADEAVALVRSAGVRHIWSTDCISHPTNVIAMAPALAGAFQTLI